MKKFTPVVAALSLMFTLLAATPAAAACPTGWGSTKETSDAHPDAVMRNARAGEHACFDRFVVVVRGDAPGYDVRYVDQFVPTARGDVVELRGKATLEVVLLGTRAHDSDGEPTYQPDRRAEMVDVEGFRTFRQVYWGGTFEGTTTMGIGVRGRLPFRVHVVPGPGDRTRLVVDVAHTW